MMEFCVVQKSVTLNDLAGRNDCRRMLISVVAELLLVNIYHCYMIIDVNAIREMDKVSGSRRELVRAATIASQWTVLTFGNIL